MGATRMSFFIDICLILTTQGVGLAFMNKLNEIVKKMIECGEK